MFFCSMCTRYRSGQKHRGGAGTHTRDEHTVVTGHTARIPGPRSVSYTCTGTVQYGRPGGEQTQERQPHGTVTIVFHLTIQACLWNKRKITANSHLRNLVHDVVVSAMRARSSAATSAADGGSATDDVDEQHPDRPAESVRIKCRVVFLSALLASSFFVVLLVSLLTVDVDAVDAPATLGTSTPQAEAAHGHCIIDELLSKEPDHSDGTGTWRTAVDGERFLLYAPQFGLGNQQITLRNAVIWALVLNRTLVLPHLLSHSGCSNATLCASSPQEMATHDAAFTLEQSAMSNLAPLRVIEMTRFLQLRLRPRRLLVLTIKARWAYRMTDEYWSLLGVKWHREQPALHVPLNDPTLKDPFRPADIQSSFRGCGHHAVLAFRSLFAAADVGKGVRWPSPGQRRVDSVIMPTLYRPSRSLLHAAERLTGVLRETASRSSGGAVTSGSQQQQQQPGATRAGTTGGTGHGLARVATLLACVHIRLGDIVPDCKRYEEESKLASGRAWVKSHFQKGYTCHQTPEALEANLNALLARVHQVKDGATRPRPLVIYAAIEDATALDHPRLRPFNVSSLASLKASGAFDAPMRESLKALPSGLLDVLLDQLVCARAEHLVLNIFSTFSQMMQTRIGLDHADVVGGWTRDLSTRQQAALHLDVRYWRAVNQLDRH